MSNIQNEILLEQAAEQCAECLSDGFLTEKDFDGDIKEVPCKCQILGSLPEPMECGATEGDR